MDSCNDYDTKPVEFAGLLGKIQSLLGKKDEAQDCPGGMP
jgi:hypothetical protein